MLTGSLGKEKCFGLRRYSLRGFLPQQTLPVSPASAEQQRMCIRQRSVKEVSTTYQRNCTVTCILVLSVPGYVLFFLSSIATTGHRMILIHY